MNVVRTDEALNDRNAYVLYVAIDNPDAAIRLDDLFTEAGESLSQFPRRGRPGWDENPRELVIHKNYVLVYGIDEEADTVYIKTVLHTSQNRKENFSS
ncbi:MAG: type II toxin-antitoxin system RelE/ParE family toxin [Desulfovibrio sp.]|nr:type II toxin-antitoxin system RelE/ParE family toxin [Desulfovibrio sp.]